MIALEQMACFGIPPVGIIHVGANEGGEFEDYCASTAKKVVYVEPIPRVFDVLREKVEREVGHYAINALCAEADDLCVNFGISSNNGESSSFLELGRHGSLYPQIGYTENIAMMTKTLDSIVRDSFAYSDFNLLVLDTQGTELRVLRGARNVLANIDCILTEVSEEPLYEDGCTLEQIVEFLKPFGFKLKWLQINPHAWGDAFFVRRWDGQRQVTLPAPPPGAVNIALRKPARQSSLSSWSRPNDAAGAVSGQLSGTFGFHTARERNPWWEVDLEAFAQPVEIRIHNRLDVASRRASTIRIMTSLNRIAWQCVHDQRGENFGGADGRPLRVMLTGHTARYVRVQLIGEDYLHLDEVEVYAVTPLPRRRP